jgi:hypothetical protein
LRAPGWIFPPENVFVPSNVVGQCSFLVVLFFGLFDAPQATPLCRQARGPGATPAQIPPKMFCFTPAIFCFTLKCFVHPKCLLGLPGQHMLRQRCPGRSPLSSNYEAQVCDQQHVLGVKKMQLNVSPSMLLVHPNNVVFPRQCLFGQLGALFGNDALTLRLNASKREAQMT